MELCELRPGLYRWTARHPDWEPDPAPGSPGDWPPDVGCVAYRAPDAFLLIDALVPSGREGLWDELDVLVREHGQRVVVVTTVALHRSSRDDTVRRYRASTSRARRALPSGVETIPIRRAGETMVWLPEARTLVPGDRILGDDGGLRLCPDSWLRYLPGGITRDELREALRPLLDLPIELVLVSHGEPVLQNGREALAEALS